MKLSDLYSSLFVIRFSLIFQKNFGGGGKTERNPEESRRKSSGIPGNEGTILISVSKKGGRGNCSPAHLLCWMTGLQSRAYPLLSRFSDTLGFTASPPGGCNSYQTHQSRVSGGSSGNNSWLFFLPPPTLCMWSSCGDNKTKEKTFLKEY